MAISTNTGRSDNTGLLKDPRNFRPRRQPTACNRFRGQTARQLADHECGGGTIARQNTGGSIFRGVASPLTISSVPYVPPDTHEKRRRNKRPARQLATRFLGWKLVLWRLGGTETKNLQFLLSARAHRSLSRSGQRSSQSRIQESPLACKKKSAARELFLRRREARRSAFNPSGSSISLSPVCRCRLRFAISIDPSGVFYAANRFFVSYNWSSAIFGNYVFTPSRFRPGWCHHINDISQIREVHAPK